MLNLRPLLKELTIQDKDLNLVPLDLSATSEFAWAQSIFVDEVERQYNAGLPVRIIVLKARQIGITTVSEGVLFNWNFIHPGTSSLLLANEKETAEGILAKARLYWETWPFRRFYNLKYHTKNHMQWIETRSSLRAGTARNTAIGRGMTFNAIHATECAYYPDPRTLMKGLNQTLPHKHGTIMVLESTANGSGDWWHTQWLAAENRESDFIPLFFPWYKHFEYQMKTTLCTTQELTPYEQWLLKLGASYENIQWRRWAIPNKMEGDEESFAVEYPAIPEEAFLATGRPIFPRTYLNNCFIEKSGARGFFVENNDGSVKFVFDPSGNVTLYAKPAAGDTRWDRYFIAGDPSETIEGDPACIQVINRKTFEQVAVWHGRIDPINFAKEMMLMGKFYNWATLCPEIMGGGQASIATILNSNYPHVWQNKYADHLPGSVSNLFGWSTNFRYKSWAIGELKKLIIDKSVIIHDKRTYNQLANYVVRSDGEWGNANKDIHDDAVMALAIAVTASKADGPFVEEGYENAGQKGSTMHDLFEQEYGEMDWAS